MVYQNKNNNAMTITSVPYRTLLNTEFFFTICNIAYVYSEEAKWINIDICNNNCRIYHMAMIFHPRLLRKLHKECDQLGFHLADLETEEKEILSTAI